jgi:hypothetical protein
MPADWSSDRHQDRGATAGARIGALGLALTLIVYGIVSPPDPFEASLAMEASALDEQTEVSAPSVQAVASHFDASAVESGQRIEAPRECAPGKGFADACIYE